jgi:outer membrane protein TolC
MKEAPLVSDLRWVRIAILCALPATLPAQTPLNWQQIKDKFKAANPTLKAAQLNIDESRAAEITAYLRPNPDVGLSMDGVQISRNLGRWRPLQGVVETPSISYLRERRNKRGLRRDQAKESTTIAESTYLDQERSLVFNLRTALVQILQEKAVLQTAKENLDYWDHELDINRKRFKAGDLAQVDLNRLELQRVQFESDYETAIVNLRTAKIQLLTLLNDRTPIDANNFKVKNPERFPLAAAGEHVAAPELNVTGVVNPDVSRQVPVPSLATGRVVEISARLSDEVKKGQLLFKVRSSDIAGAYSDYRKAVKNEELAVKNEELAKIQLARAKLLYEDGAIPKSAYEIADNVEIGTRTALENAKVDTETTNEHLKLLGSDPAHPSGIVEGYAPVSGTITDQQITNSAGVQALTPPNPFTISDLSRVWIVCDVYENNMAQVHIGEYADIHLAAYPNRVLKGRIGNILPIVDPNIRTAKVRLEVENPVLKGNLQPRFTATT